MDRPRPALSGGAILFARQAAEAESEEKDQ